MVIERKKLALCVAWVAALVTAYGYAMSQYNPTPAHPAYSNHPRW